MNDRDTSNSDSTGRFLRADSHHHGGPQGGAERSESDDRHTDVSSATAGSDEPADLLTCAVVTPVGPGHQDDYAACLASIERAIAHHTGPFDHIDIISVDDTEGKLGRSRARNQGVAEAQQKAADWIFFLDADDRMSEGAFEQFGPLSHQYDAVWGLIVETTPESSEPRLRIEQVVSIEALDELLLFDPFLTLQMGHFVRTEVAAQNPFDEAMDAGEDFHYHLRLWSGYRCRKAPVEFFVNRRRRSSSGPRSASWQQWQDSTSEQIESERQRRGLDVQTTETMAVRNRCVDELQAYLRTHSLRVSDYMESAHAMPSYGYYEFDKFAGANFLMYSGNDDLVSLSTTWLGEYEPISTRIWQALARGCRLILDVGAYTGFYSFLAARAEPSSKVVGFEPHSRNFGRYMLNRNLNHLENVLAVNAAVFDTQGKSRLASHLLGAFLPAKASLVSDYDAKANSFDPVPTVQIDEVIRQGSLGSVDLAKIQVEGAEAQVLAGMSEVLGRDHPDLLVECSAHTDVEAITKQLAPLGYNFFRISEARKAFEQTGALLAGSATDGSNRIASRRTLEEIAGLAASAPQVRTSNANQPA